MENRPKKMKMMIIEDVIKPEDFFMQMAMLSGRRSQGTEFKAGACIVGENDEIVATGFDSMPLELSDLFKVNNEHNFDYECHAELNAISNSGRSDFSGCRMYVTRMPCSVCSKLIIQSNIKQVYYPASSREDKYTEAMFTALEAEGFQLVSV